MKMIRKAMMKLIRRIALGEKYNSEMFITYLRGGECLIGDDCIFYDPSKTRRIAGL